MHGMAHDPGEADGTAAAAVGGSGKSTGKRIEVPFGLNICNVMGK